MPVLFIDSNQYLNLYRLAAGKKLLAAVEEQKPHVFVSAQIADEVRQNKLGVAESFFQKKRFAEFPGIGAAIPDLLLGITDAELADFQKQLKDTARATNKIVEKLNGLVTQTLDRISRSEDVISRRLDVLFDGAAPATDDELKRARQRKELGNPPGKPGDPLGDQITWEQLLTHVNGRKRLWIITDDGDYGVKQNDSLLLNPLLRKEIEVACGRGVAVHCFSSLLAGIEHFGKHAGVRAKTSRQRSKPRRSRRRSTAFRPLDGCPSLMTLGLLRPMIIDARWQLFSRRS